MPAHDRAAITALFAIDAAMGDVVRTTREPMLGAIRLAWWRERLEELDAGISVPGEPRLQAVVLELLPRGIGGRDLAALEGGWLRLFDPFPWTTATSEAISIRGNWLFGLGARLLGHSDERIQAAGGLWALVDVARHTSDGRSRTMLIEQARTFARGLGPGRFAIALRPLSTLAALAIRDASRGERFEAEGCFARRMAAFSHRITRALSRGS